MSDGRICNSRTYFKMIFKGQTFRKHNPSAALRIQVVMKRHSSLGSVGCVDCGSFGEN
jgi:hypothetical protein